MEVPDDWRASKAPTVDPRSPAPGDGRPPPGRIRRGLKRLWRWFGLLVAAGLVWTAWAAAALYDFHGGLRDGDPISLERRIDWSRVSQSLRQDLQARPARDGGSIDAQVSRQGIVRLLRTANPAATAGAAGAGGAEAPVFGWSRVHYAFFSGGPFSFRVDVGPDGGTAGPPLVLLFKWNGDWELTRIFLPGELAAAAAKSAQIAAAAPPPPGAERAVLYEEDPTDANGKRYTGSVVWRTERLPPTTGGASELAVIAKVSIPSRPLGMTMTIRRNLDKTLPASHTIDVKFDAPANSAGGEIDDVAGVMMKPNEEAAGQSLAATRVKVSGNLFLIGLSAIELDVKHNMEILKDRTWLGVPFVYHSHSRALLAIEKGKTGTSSIAEAMAQWGAAAAAGADKDQAGDKAKTGADKTNADDGKAKKP